MGTVLGGRSLPEPPITADPPATQLRFPPTTPTAAVPQDDPGPAPRSWESAWMPNPDRMPAGGTGAEPTVTPPQVRRDDMAAPIVVPRDAGEDFWEQTFSLPPSLPALDLDQGIAPTAPPESRTALRQQPQPPPLSTLNPNPLFLPNEPPPKLLPAQSAAPDEGAPPPPPTLGLGPDSVPALPRLDPQNLQ